MFAARTTSRHFGNFGVQVLGEPLRRASDEIRAEGGDAIRHVALRERELRASR